MVQAKSEMEVGTWTQKFRSSKKAESSTILRANRKQPFLNHFLTCSHCFLPSFLPPCLPPFFTFSFFLWTALGLGCCLRAFSGCSAQPSGCQGFCCCSTQAWGACASQGYWWCLLGPRVCRLQELWLMVFVAPQHVESSQTRDWTHVPCGGGRFLSTVPAGESQKQII